MTIDSELSDRSDDLLGEARRWVLRLRLGETNQDDIDALARWRAESPAHRRAFAEANAQWDVLRQAARNVVAKHERAIQASPDASASRELTRRVWLGGAMAASIGGATYLAVRPPLDLWPSLSELNADYRTDIGERRLITFADKVSIEMNTRTSLAAAGTGMDARQIELIGGEIAITTGLGTAASSERFVVVAGEGRSSATRAMFDLRRDGQNVSVTCLEGEVQVECRNDLATLKARQQLVYGVHGLGDIAATDGRAVEAWRQGLLVFDYQPLSQVVPEINRYRPGRIVLMNEAIGRLPLDATFRLDRIDEVVPKIAYLFNLKVRTLPGGVVLLS